MAIHSGGFLRPIGISVKKLKEMNNLKTDAIVVGQKLKVPVPTSPGPNQKARPDAQAALEKAKAKKKSKASTTGEGSIKTNEAP